MKLRSIAINAKPVFRRFKALFQKEPPRPPPTAAADFHRRLQLAKLQLSKGSQGQKSVPAADQAAVEAPDETFPFKAYTVSPEGALASALEKILQGERAPSDVFLELYHKGFVFKEKEKRWAITEAGKSLIERHKLSDPVQCRVNGVECPKSWS